MMTLKDIENILFEITFIEYTKRYTKNRYVFII